MQNSDEKVVDVFWHGGASLLAFGYAQAAVNTQVVGQQVCYVIKKILETYPYMKIHVMGHSLGGHTSGFAGKYCRNQDGSPIIHKITGMY